MATKRPCRYQPGDRLTLRYTCPPPANGAPACHEHDDPAEGVTGTVLSVHWDVWSHDYRMHVAVDGRVFDDGTQVISTCYRESHVLGDATRPLDLLELLAVTR